MIIKQSPFQSPVFWAAVITNIAAVVYLVVAPETATLLKAAVGAVLAIIDAYAAANNAHNPNGFGANEVAK